MNTNNPFLRRQKGFIVVALFIFMGMMSAYVAANVRTLAHLKRELQLIEKKQMQHWRTR